MMNQTILVIDDDNLIRSLVTHILTGAGYVVEVRPDGASGVAGFDELHPALVILDIAMPQMSGFEVAQKIREIEQRDDRPRTPIMMLTAYARHFFKSSGSMETVDSYLTKPIAPDKLLAHIQAFLNTSNENNALASPD